MPSDLRQASVTRIEIQGATANQVAEFLGIEAETKRRALVRAVRLYDDCRNQASK